MRRLIAVALDSSKPRRLLAGHCLLAMANTGTGFGELKHLHRNDVFMDASEPYITVTDGLKTAKRRRVIALNWIALRSMRWIVKRWEHLGGWDPDHFVLPHMARKTEEQRENRNHHRSRPIFHEPMLTIRNAARKILNEAGLQHLDMYDCRSHFARKIMEDPDVSESEAGEWIGHSKVTKEMNRRYFAPKMKKMVKAVAKVAVDPEPVPQQQPGSQPPQSEPSPALSPALAVALAENPLQSLIQAEIERQVAQALQAMVTQPQPGAKPLLVFPGGGGQ